MEKNAKQSGKVWILMSAYNGETYLERQLDSIFAQDYNNVELLVRDDGSVDRTREILKKYDRIHENMHVLYGKNKGVINSFFSLLSHVEDDGAYYAFSDQDDIWLQDKISSAVAAISREDENLPVLYASEVQPVDENGNLLQKAVLSRHVRPCFENALVENICVGCTSVMNRQAFLLVRDKKPDFTIMHDFWMYLTISCFGKVIYDEKPHIHYRQHSGNVLGVSTSWMGLIRRRIQNFKKHRKTLYRQAEEFQKLYTPTGKNGTLLREFLQTEKNMGSRLSVLRNKTVFRQNAGDDFIFRMLLFTGIL